AGLEERRALLTFLDDQLTCDEVPLERLADGIPTPFFLFSERTIRANYQALESAFGIGPGGCLIAHCVKTNYEAALPTRPRDLGGGAMVRWGWEVRLAVEAGFAPDRISYHGPCKTRSEIEDAIAAGVGLIHAYSAAEIELLADVAAARGRPVDVALHVPIPG